MKNKALSFACAVVFAICGVALPAVYFTGYKQGQRASIVVVNRNWEPKIGDKVMTDFHPDYFGGPSFVTTITNVVRVGRERCQTGLLVYGDGLPGVDAAWVKPAP